MDLTGYDKIDSLFTIEKLKVKGTSNMNYNHYHDAYEIYYLLSGERTYFIKDRTYNVTKGNLVFINMNDLHKTVDLGKGKVYHERILINFKKDFIESLLTPELEEDLCNLLKGNSSLVLMSFEESRFIEELLFRMLKEQTLKLEYSQLYTKTMLLELLVLINRYSKNNDIPPKKDMNSENIFKIAKYLNSNYENEISLKLLSEKFFISESYLSRSFKAVTGFNIITYLNTIRIKEAQRMLIDSDNNITKIAYMVGYDSITHFERVFKSIVCISPSKYRSLNKKIKNSFK